MLDNLEVSGPLQKERDMIQIMKERISGYANALVSSVIMAVYTSLFSKK